MPASATEIADIAAQKTFWTRLAVKMNWKLQSWSGWDSGQYLRTQNGQKHDLAYNLVSDLLASLNA